MDTSLTLVLENLRAGLPVLMIHFLATLALLAVGVAVYMAITPFHERRLVAEGNVAAGIVLGGTVFALAIPLAATLATSAAVIDVLIWGVVALLLQLIAFAAASLLIKNLRASIDSGNMAAAMTLIGVQLAVALLNAATMAG